MSRAPVPQTTSHGEQPQKSFLRRYGWLLAGIGLTYASLLLLTTTHYGATGLGSLEWADGGSFPLHTSAPTIALYLYLAREERTACL